MNLRRARAFTLVELLVTIAIIAILASLLLPALARAKAKAQRTKCVSDFKQWGLGMILYADQHDGELPRERGVTGTQTWGTVSSPTNYNVWYNAIPEAMSTSTASNYASAPAGFYSSSFFTCPSAKFIDPLGFANFSRAMNAKLIVGGVVARLTENESMRLIFVEAGGSAEPLLPGQIGPYDGRSYVKWERTSGRHGQRGNGVFGDGHVEALPASELLSTNSPPF